MSDLTTKAAEIRAGLVGVTPGPWTAHLPEGGAWSVDADHLQETVCRVEPWSPEQDEKDAAHIARLDPATVLAFRDERDQNLALIEQQAAELAEARADLAAQIAGHRLSAAHATRHLIERDGVKRPGVVLLDALRRYGFPMSEAAWRNTGDDAPVNAQASVEARALHRAAVVFFQAISGADHAG